MDCLRGDGEEARCEFVASSLAWGSLTAEAACTVPRVCGPTLELKDPCPLLCCWGWAGAQTPDPTEALLPKGTQCGSFGHYLTVILFPFHSY